MKALCNSANQKGSDFLVVTGAWPGARPPHAPPGLSGSSERTAGRCKEPCLRVSGIRIQGWRVSGFSLLHQGKAACGRAAGASPGGFWLLRESWFAGGAWGASHAVEHGPLPRHAVVFLLFCRSPRMETM